MTTETPPKEKIKDKNIVRLLKTAIKRTPYKKALISPYIRDARGRTAYTHLTFKQLDQETDCLAHGLVRMGIGPGTRVIVEIPTTTEFYCIIYALLKVGATPVFGDPCLTTSERLRCLAKSRAAIFIGSPSAHWHRILHSQNFRSVTKIITAGRRFAWGGLTTEAIRMRPWKPFEPVQVNGEDPALIYFSPSTNGLAQGRVYSHQTIGTQIEIYCSRLDLNDAAIDLQACPLFSILDMLLGISVVLPESDNVSPQSLNPEKSVEAILNQGITHLFASPRFIHIVGRYGKQRGIKLSSIKQVILTDSPIQPEAVVQFRNLLNENTDLYIQFTESPASPLAIIESREFLQDTLPLTEKGFGHCIGQPLEESNLRLIKVSDEPIEAWSEELNVATGDIGELTVKDVYTAAPLENPPEDKNLLKIKENAGYRLRSENLGWMDKNGRIWYCGQKSDRVVNAEATLYPLPCEALFNTHTSVSQSALIGIGPPNDQKPVLCVELLPDNDLDKKIIEKELLDIAKSHAMTQSIEKILFLKSLPMSANLNICRKKLIKRLRKAI